MSDKPLALRLQVKPGRTLAVINASPAIDKMIGVALQRAPVEHADVTLLFAHDRADLDGRFADFLAKSPAKAIVWLAYPKLSSPLAADLSRDIIHKLAPSHGLTTVASVAVDADWSALRFRRS